MERKEITEIVNKVYPLISANYKSNAKVELYSNIFDRLNAIPAEGEDKAFAEYSWDTNKIYLVCTPIILCMSTYFTCHTFFTT